MMNPSIRCIETSIFSAAFTTVQLMFAVLSHYFDRNTRCSSEYGSHYAPRLHYWLGVELDVAVPFLGYWYALLDSYPLKSLLPRLCGLEHRLRMLEEELKSLQRGSGGVNAGLVLPSPLHLPPPPTFMICRHNSDSMPATIVHKVSIYKIGPHHSLDSWNGFPLPVLWLASIVASSKSRCQY